MDTNLIIQYIAVAITGVYVMYFVFTLRDHAKKGIKDGGFPADRFGFLLFIWLLGATAGFVLYSQPPVGIIAPYIRPFTVIFFSLFILVGTGFTLFAKSKT